MIPLLLGCTPDAALVASVEVVQPSPVVPYARLLELSFRREVTVSGTASDGRHSLELAAGPGRDLSVPLIGLYADAHWVVALTATDGAGREHPLPLVSFRTQPLPTVFPRIDLRVGEATPEPTLLSLDATDRTSWLVVVDALGEVAWVFDGERGDLREAHPSGDGAAVQMMHRDQLVEMDWLGRDRRRLSSLAAADPTGVPVAGAETFHHELVETSRGTWLTLDKEGVRFEDFPVSYDTPALRSAARIQSDRLLELDPDSGAVLRSWSAADHLDAGRIGYDSLFLRMRGFDWLHANAIGEAGDDGEGWIVSLRNQDAVVRVDAATGEVRWILANHDNWAPAFRDRLLAPEGDLAWPYHQHGAKWRPGIDGREQVLLFDNGNGRSSPWTGQPYVEAWDNASRVVAYEVDPIARTVTQRFSAGLEPSAFSPIMGDADWLADDHVLATFASVQYEGQVAVRSLGRSGFGRVVEFDGAGRVVWDLDVWGPLGEPGWDVYRSERLPRWPGVR